MRRSRQQIARQIAVSAMSAVTPKESDKLDPGMQPFNFYTERRLVRLTGLKASNLEELAVHLRDVSGASISYHTHQAYLMHHFQKPVFYNDFAAWVSASLLERALGERLADIDMRLFTSIRGLREAIIRTIDHHMSAAGHERRTAPPGEEFHFCESQSFILPTGKSAVSVPDFFRKVESATNESIFFHFIEARLRLGAPTNDFSAWLEDCGEPRLARAINALNPYVMTLDELKARIVRIGRVRNR